MKMSLGKNLDFSEFSLTLGRWHTRSLRTESFSQWFLVSQETMSCTNWAGDVPRVGFPTAINQDAIFYSRTLLPMIMLTMSCHNRYGIAGATAPHDITVGRATAWHHRRPRGMTSSDREVGIIRGPAGGEILRSACRGNQHILTAPMDAPRRTCAIEPLFDFRVDMYFALIYVQKVVHKSHLE